MFQLKKGQEAFTPVEGLFAGRKFIPGQAYSEIPPGTSERFTEIKEAIAPEGEVAKPAKADKRAAS